MRKLLAAVAVLSAASITTMAFGQIKPVDRVTTPGAATAQQQMPIGPPVDFAAPDARSLASDADVADARRYYRAQCEQHESSGFCECVTAGVAQALMPAEVRIAARTIGERITAEGDAAMTSESDSTITAESSAERIEQIEGHYADACAQFRG